MGTSWPSRLDFPFGKQLCFGLGWQVGARSRRANSEWCVSGNLKNFDTFRRPSPAEEGQKQNKSIQVCCLSKRFCKDRIFSPVQTGFYPYFSIIGPYGLIFHTHRRSAHFDQSRVMTNPGGISCAALQEPWKQTCPVRRERVRPWWVSITGTHKCNWVQNHSLHLTALCGL